MNTIRTADRSRRETAGRRTPERIRIKGHVLFSDNPVNVTLAREPSKLFVNLISTGNGKHFPLIVENNGAEHINGNPIAQGEGLIVDPETARRIVHLTIDENFAFTVLGIRPTNLEFGYPPIFDLGKSYWNEYFFYHVVANKGSKLPLLAAALNDNEMRISVKIEEPKGKVIQL